MDVHSMLSLIINLLLAVVILRYEIEKSTKVLLLGVAILGMINAALWLLGVK